MYNRAKQRSKGITTSGVWVPTTSKEAPIKSETYKRVGSVVFCDTNEFEAKKLDE